MAPLLGSGHAASVPVQDSSSLFPLPLLPTPSRASPLLGRGVSQRVGRFSCSIRAANETIQTLNQLSGCKDGRTALSPSAARDQAVEEILAVHCANRPPALLESPEAALDALLGSKATAYEDGEQVHSAPFVQDNLSLPALAGQCDLVSCLEGEDLADLTRFEERLMFTHDELREVLSRDGRARTYWDPILENNPGKYLTFLKSLRSRNMLRFSQVCLSTVGIFVVKKKMVSCD